MNTDGMTERIPVFENLSIIWQRRREKILKRTEIPEYPFGIEDLDRVTHGITKGKVTVIAARTSEAKTAFTLQAAFNIADKGKNIVYVSLEDDSEQIAERVFSNIREIDNQELITGRVDRAILEDKAIQELFKKVKFLPLENYGHNFEEIQRVINLLNPKPDLVFLDYVQMIEQLPKETEYEALSRFAQKCKKFAEMNNIGLVIVSQINRAGAKEGRPSAHHLQGCGRLEQVCDLLLIIYCPYNNDDSSADYAKGDSTHESRGMEECPPDYVEITVAKNKNGMRNRVVKTRFIGKYYKFIPWSETTQTTYNPNKFIEAYAKD
jgi:replicative DNA helicase